MSNNPIDNRAYLSFYKDKNIILTGTLVSVPINNSIVILTFKNIYHGEKYVCDHLNIKIKKNRFEKMNIKLLNRYEFKGRVYSYKSIKTINNMNVYIRNYSLKKIIYIKTIKEK